MGFGPARERQGRRRGGDRREDDVQEQGHIQRQEPAAHRERVERGQRPVPRAVQDGRQEQRDNGHPKSDRDARHQGCHRHHRRDGDAEGHSGEDSQGRRGLHTGRQGQPGDPAGGRGDDVQLRAPLCRGHGRGQGARADRGQALPCVRSRRHHKNVPQGLAGAEVRRQGQGYAPHRRQGNHRGALLHQQPARRKPLQHLHPQPLGGREQAPLDTRHDLPRGPAAQTMQNGRTKLLARQEVRPERPQKGQIQAQPRKQTPQGRMGLGLFDATITNLMRLPWFLYIFYVISIFFPIFATVIIIS